MERPRALCSTAYAKKPRASLRRCGNAFKAPRVRSEAAGATPQSPLSTKACMHEASVCLQASSSGDQLSNGCDLQRCWHRLMVLALLPRTLQLQAQLAGTRPVKQAAAALRLSHMRR
jgi:hypothetical protein